MVVAGDVADVGRFEKIRKIVGGRPASDEVEVSGEDVRRNPYHVSFEDVEDLPERAGRESSRLQREQQLNGEESGRVA